MIREYRTLGGALAAGLLLLQACGTTPPVARATPAAVAPPPAPRIAPLDAERQWLQSWFKGTPVVVAQQADGALRVEVPRAHSFEAGRSEVKPALAAVLDKIAESLRRVPQARLPLAAAPGDTPAVSPLAMQRAHQLRIHLLLRGVSPVQMGPETATSAAAVRLRIDLNAN